MKVGTRKVKKFIALFMVMAMIVSTIVAPNNGVFAEEIAANVDNSFEMTSDNEKINVISEESDTASADIWSKLELALVEEQSVEDDVLVNLSITKNENTYVFSAFDISDNSIKLSFEQGSDECIVVYENDDTKVEETMEIALLANNVQVEKVNGYEDCALIEEQVNSLLIAALNVWEKQLNSVDLSFEALGFEAWIEYVTNIEESIEDSIVGTNDESNAELKEANEISDNGEIEDFDADSEEALDEMLVLDDELGEELVVDEIVSDENENDLVDEIAESEEIEIVVDDEIVDEALDSPMPATVVERVKFNYDSAEIKVGQSLRLTVSYYPENAPVTPVWYVNSTYSSYLTVNSDGVVNALKPYSYGPINVYCILGSSFFAVPITLVADDNPYYYDEDDSAIYTYSGGQKIIIADGIWVGNFVKNFTYTGSAIKQELDVYCGSEKLTINKDYTLTYKNNINVASGDSIKSPSVTITMKGQYSGKKTLYYSISPASFMFQVTNTTPDVALAYNGKEQKFNPTVVFNTTGKKLVKDKDYIIEYPTTGLIGTNDGSATEVYYTITGIGNFGDSMYGNRYYIISKQNSINSAKVTTKATYYYDGTYPTTTELANALDLKLTFAGEKTIHIPQNETSDFDLNFVFPSNYNGTGKLYVSAKNGGSYKGSVVKTFKVTPKYSLSKVAKVTSDFESEVLYRKDASYNVQPNTVGLELISNGTKLTRGIHYEISYLTNTKVGTATMVFTGMGEYSGTIKKTFKLVNNSPVFVVTNNGPVDYVQGGARPNLTVLSEISNTIHEDLVENVDYTVTVTNNNQPGTANYKITGKGNYSKYVPTQGTFVINNADISKCSVTVSDKAYSAKPGAFKSVPVITAPNGKKLVAGKDYDKNIEYIYDDWDDQNSPYYNCPDAGSVVVVKVYGINSYSGTYVTGCYRVYDSKYFGMNKLYISVDSKVYTGKNIELKLDDDVHIYPSATDLKNKTNEITNSSLGASKFLRIISYKNNLKAGNATVTFGTNLNGPYKFGGTKAVTFKILKKNYDSPKSVTSIELDKSTVTLNSITSMDTSTITATVYPAIAANKNVIWTSSKPAAVEIVSATNTTCDIRAKGAGVSVITATTQDGQKVAKCTVNSIYKKITSVTMSQANATLAINNMMNLSYTIAPADAYIGYSSSWSSSNPSVATVDSTGKVKGITPGNAVISYTINGFTAKCNLTVTGPKKVERIDLNRNSITSPVGQTYNLTYSVYPSDAYSPAPVWKSSDSSVATVDSTGKVTTVANGDAVITLTVYNMVAQCLVKVKPNSWPAKVDVTNADSNDLINIPAAKTNDDLSDTNAIRRYIVVVRDENISPKNLYFPAGGYDLSNATGNFVEALSCKDMSLFMHSDAVLKMLPGKDDCDLVGIRRGDNFTVIGGTIDGNIGGLTDVKVSSRSFGAGISIEEGSKNVTIDGVTIKNCPGAGIYIGERSENITIKNCVIMGCKGSGIEIEGPVDGVNIINCTIINNGYSQYSYGGYGIHITTNGPYNTNVKNVNVTNCLFSNNKLYDFATTRGNTSYSCAIDQVNFDKCSFFGKIDIGVGTNITFTNTKNRPVSYKNKVTNSTTYPD